MEKVLLPLLFLLLLLVLRFLFFTAFAICSAPRGHVSLARLDVQRQQQQERIPCCFLSMNAVREAEREKEGERNRERESSREREREREGSGREIEQSSTKCQQNVKLPKRNWQIDLLSRKVGNTFGQFEQLPHRSNLKRLSAAFNCFLLSFQSLATLSICWILFLTGFHSGFT